MKKFIIKYFAHTPLLLWEDDPENGLDLVPATYYTKRESANVLILRLRKLLQDVERSRLHELLNYPDDTMHADRARQALSRAEQIAGELATIVVFPANDFPPVAIEISEAFAEALGNIEPRWSIDDWMHRYSKMPSNVPG